MSSNLAPSARGIVLALVVTFGLLHAPLSGQYFPPRGSGWETRTPEQVGMDPAGIAAALEFAAQAESSTSRDLEEAHQTSFGREPLGFSVGPFTVREGAAGMIIKDGYIIGEWGDPQRVDMTFSVTKSFLSTTVGELFEDGLIESLDDTVREYMAPVDLPVGDGEPGIDRTGFGGIDPARLFETEHNRQITWDHLLRQSSDWEGTLWGKPDWADRPSRDAQPWRPRDHVPVGTVFEYNDTRVNLLALAALQVVRRPLPQILRERIMDPIGASSTWRWTGYETSWVTIDGVRMNSVSGGGHWGGGMLINARDLGRFGLLTLHNGNWGGEQLISEEWMAMATTPGPANGTYGFMNFYLNVPNTQGRQAYSNAPSSAFYHVGNGSNIVYVDRENDLVVVARWIPGGAMNELLGQVIGSIRE
jgi:CubicO group peptidase (beta-lactamase class C family)